MKAEKFKQSAKKVGSPTPLPPGNGNGHSTGTSPRFRLGLSGKRGAFRFRTLTEAEHTLQRVTNMMVEREAAAEALRAAKKEGCDPKEWPAMPPLRGLSNEGAGKIINVINAFIISRRFQDEVAEKRRVDDLESRLNEALELNERYGKRLEEIVASRQGNN